MYHEKLSISLAAKKVVKGKYGHKRCLLMFLSHNPTQSERAANKIRGEEQQQCRKEDYSGLTG